MVKPQPILQISCSPTIHPGSCSQLTSNSFHCRPVVWNHMVAVRSAVQPHLYGTNIPHSVRTAKTFNNFTVKLKCLICITLCDCLLIVIYTDWPCVLRSPRLDKFAHYKSSLFYHYLYCNCENYPLSPLKPRFRTLMEQYLHTISDSVYLVHQSFMWFLWLNWRKPTFIPSLIPTFQNVDLLWCHRYKSWPPAIVTSQWPIVPVWFLWMLS